MVGRVALASLHPRAAAVAAVLAVAQGAQRVRRLPVVAVVGILEGVQGDLRAVQWVQMQRRILWAARVVARWESMH